MSRVKSPHEKKRLALDHDHVPTAEYPKAARKTFPKLEAKAQRAQRKAVHTRLTSATGTVAHDVPDVDVGDIPRKQVRKRGKPKSLRESIAHKKATRTARTGRKARKKAGQK